MATTPQLVDRYGMPLQRAVLTQDVAGPSITGVRSPISGHPGDGLNPRRLASILREADEGEPMRYFELAETIEERDHHYTGVLGTRKRSVAQLEITVEAASDDVEHVKHADMVRAWLKRGELEDELFNILDSVGKGLSYVEIIWDTSEGQWRPARLEWRDPRWFRPDRRDLATPLLRGDNGDEPLPAFKFIRSVTRAKSGLPVKSGIARVAAWSWLFKAYTQRDWAIFTQTYGQPIRVGKYPAGASEADKETLFRAVANIAGDCAAIIPEAMLIDFVESESVGSSSELYEKRSDWLDKQVSKLVLGQTATTDSVTGGLGSGKEHRQVQEDIERADAKGLAATLTRDLIVPWISLEYGPQQLYPSMRIGRAEQLDQKLTLQALTTLVPMGLRVEKSVMADMFGLPDAPAGADILRAPRREPKPGAPDDPIDDEDDDEETAAQAVSAGGDDTVDHLAEAAEAIVGPGTDALIDTIRAMINEATTLEEVRDRLLALRPQMPAAGLASLLRLALVMAELSGRDEIADG
ncbi:MAG: DUF935 domain-containing protein [Bauldia sp.]